MIGITKSLLLSAAFAALSVSPLAAAAVRPLEAALAEQYGLDPDFYKKATMAEGVLIATSEKVCDFAHLEAAYQFGRVMQHVREDVAERIREAGVLCIIVAHDELTSDVPQFRTDKTGRDLDFFNWRQRGFLTRVDGRMVVFFAEEDVLEYEGGMQLESILIHEFGHVIDFAGFDEELRGRLTALYENAVEKGLWNDARAALRFRRVKGDEPVRLLDALIEAFPEQEPELLRQCLAGGDILVNGEPSHVDVEVTGKDQVLVMFGGDKQAYAAKNRAEYFAEAVQSWFDTNRTMDHDHNHIHTREQLRAYDPGLAEFSAEVLGDGEWRFVSPRERAGEGHLAGYDPGSAPEVVLADFIQEAALDYYDEYWKNYWQRLHDKYPQAAASTAE